MSATPSETLGETCSGDRSGRASEAAQAGAPEAESLPPVRAEAAGEEVAPRVFWMRVLRVVILLVLWIAVKLLAKAVTVLQLLHVLWRKHPHRAMQRLGTMVGEYTNQLWRYCTHASNQAPWPYSPWPRGESAD